MAEAHLKIIDNILDKARRNPKTIVLPEGEDVRMLKAARKSVDEKTAKVIIVDEKRTVETLAKENNLSLSGIDVIHPADYPKLNELASGLYERRKAKGMTQDEALALVKTPLYFGDMLVQKGLAAGCVAGAVNSTGNVVKAALYCIGAKEGTVSSC